MSHSAASAFGAFMSTLRQRRGLTPPQVSRLLEGTSEHVDRGSLWRLEHGERGLSMGKLTRLGRIYDVPPEVIVERWELDRELEHLGGTDTGERCVEALVAAGRRALTGHDGKWHAYACFRDAVGRASEPEDSDRVRLNLATAVRALGKNRLALYELAELERSLETPSLRPVVLDRMANCHRCLGRLDAARDLVDAAVDAVGHRDGRVAAVIHSSRANIAIARGESGEAVTWLNHALSAGRDPKNANGALRPSPGFDVSLLNMIAECHLETSSLEQARQAATVAGRVARRYGIPLGLAHAELALGRLDERAGDPTRAEVRWRRVVSIAHEIDDRRLAFAGGFYRFSRALRAGETSRANGERRKLERLLPWVPHHVPLVGAFHDRVSH